MRITGASWSASQPPRVGDEATLYVEHGKVVLSLGDFSTPVNVNTRLPRRSQADVIVAAEREIGARSYRHDLRGEPAREVETLIAYDEDDVERLDPRVAYRFKIVAVDPPETHTYVVDAQNLAVTVSQSTQRIRSTVSYQTS